MTSWGGVAWVFVSRSMSFLALASVNFCQFAHATTTVAALPSSSSQTPMMSRPLSPPVCPYQFSERHARMRISVAKTMRSKSRPDKFLKWMG